VPLCRGVYPLEGGGFAAPAAREYVSGRDAQAGDPGSQSTGVLATPLPLVRLLLPLGCTFLLQCLLGLFLLGLLLIHTFAHDSLLRAASLLCDLATLLRQSRCSR
jgi:hypothetical protein